MKEQESLAAFLQGKLSLHDFEWPPSLRPTLPYNTYLPDSHLIPEIDLQALLSCAGARSGTYSPPQQPLSPNGKLDNSTNGALEYPAAGRGSAGQLHKTASASRDNDQLTILLEAATSCGFFQVCNHAIPISALETLNSYAQKFFSMPMEHKLEIAKLLGNLVAGLNYHSGYMGGSPVDSPNKCVCESLRIASSNRSNISRVAQCLWPEEADQQAFGDALEECSRGFTKLSEELAMILLHELGVDAKEVLSEYVGGDQMAGVKFNHYPAWPQPDKTLGLPIHSDVCLFTLLWQDNVGGLQVQQNGQWLNVKPRRDALVVNIGDILQVWSNDRFKSGVHQVVLNALQSRHSIGFFYNPSGDSMLAPLPELLKRTGEPPQFKSMQNFEYRRYAIGQAFQSKWEGVDYLRC